MVKMDFRNTLKRETDSQFLKQKISRQIVSEEEINYNDKIIEQQRRTQFGFHQMNVLSRRIICCSIDIEMTHLSRKTIKNGERKTDQLTDSILIFNKN